jgi:DNA-binding MurR/RpiR family transcriptional regulator
MADTEDEEAPETAPGSYEALQHRILKRHGSLSRQLQIIARFAIEHPDFIALESVTKVARSAGVQPSAIVRFAQAVGFDGFGGLQRLLRENLITERGSYRDRIRMLGEVRTDSTGLLEEFVESAVDSLRAMQLKTSQETIVAAVAILNTADEIYLLAQKRSFAVAQYLNYALARLERRSVLVDGAGGMLDHQLARCRHGADALLAISFDPYSEQVIHGANALAKRGVEIVAITDSPLSPLIAASSVHFEIAGGPHAFRSLVAPICLVQTLVVALGQASLDPE